MLLAARCLCLGWMVVAAACGSDATPPALPSKMHAWERRARPPRDVNDCNGPRAGDRQLCESHAGRWHESLQSCICALGAYFAPDGCRLYPISEARAGTHRRIGAWAVETDAPAATLHALLVGLRADGGVSPSVDFSLHFFNIDQTRARALWGRMLKRPAEFHASGGVAFDTRVHPAMSAGDVRGACERLQGTPVRAPALCATLERLLQDLANDRIAPRYSDVSHGEGASGFYVSAVHGPGADGYYLIEAPDNIPTHRFVDLRTATGERLLVALSATGSVVGGFLQTFRPATKPRAWLESRVVYFNGAWRALGAAEVVGVGDRQGLLGAFHDARVNPGRLLPNDGRGSAVAAPVALVVIENAVDLRVPAVMERMNMSREYFNTLHAALTVDAGWWADSASHGLAVAATMVADLPRARLTYFQPEAGGLFLGPQRYRGRLTKAIRASRARVVNISQDFDGFVGDCNAYFAPVLSSFATTVLFVAAAERIGPGVHGRGCPASMGGRFANLLTVAAAEDAEDMTLAASNPGIGHADIAVQGPFSTAGVEGFGADARAVGVWQQDPSLAAATISNMAAKAFARFPEMSVLEVVDRLMNSCTPADVQVACGGVVDRDALDAWVTETQGATPRP